MSPSYAVQRCVGNRTSVTELQSGIGKFQNAQGDVQGLSVQVNGELQLALGPSTPSVPSVRVIEQGVGSIGG